jgi:hypothetical protein
MEMRVWRFVCADPGECTFGEDPPKRAHFTCQSLYYSLSLCLSLSTYNSLPISLFLILSPSIIFSSSFSYCHSFYSSSIIFLLSHFSCHVSLLFHFLSPLLVLHSPCLFHHPVSVCPCLLPFIVVSIGADESLSQSEPARNKTVSHNKESATENALFDASLEVRIVHHHIGLYFSWKPLVNGCI